MHTGRSLTRSSQNRVGCRVNAAIKLDTQQIEAELEKATLNSGAVAQNVGDVDKAMASAVTKVDAIYQVEAAATGRPGRLDPERIRDLHGAGCRGRSGEGRSGACPTRRLRGRLRHRGQS